MFLSIAVGASGSVQQGLPQTDPIPGTDVHFNVAFDQHDGKEGLGGKHFPKQNCITGGFAMFFFLFLFSPSVGNVGMLTQGEQVRVNATACRTRLDLVCCVLLCAPAVYPLRPAVADSAPCFYVCKAHACHWLLRDASPSGPICFLTGEILRNF